MVGLKIGSFSLEYCCLDVTEKPSNKNERLSVIVLKMSDVTLAFRDKPYQLLESFLFLQTQQLLSSGCVCWEL